MADRASFCEDTDAMRHLAITPVSAVLVALLGCVQRPPGWPEGQVDEEVVSAVRSWAPSPAPLRWATAGGPEIRVEVADFTVVPPWGAFTADVHFSARYADDPGSALECATTPTGPDVPETRFGCWSRADPAALHFWLAPGAGCDLRQAFKTTKRRECWQGEVTVQGQRLQLRHGALRRLGWPVQLLAWVDEREQALLVADNRRWGEVHLYAGPVAPPPGLRRALVLLTVALAWYEYATWGD